MEKNKSIKNEIKIKNALLNIRELNRTIDIKIIAKRRRKASGRVRAALEAELDIRAYHRQLKVWTDKLAALYLTRGGMA